MTLINRKIKFNKLQTYYMLTKFLKRIRSGRYLLYSSKEGFLTDLLSQRKVPFINY